MATLHLTRTIPALLPRYVSRFSCIGAACEDTCCSGWRVPLDKKTFNAYRQSGQPATGKPFAENIKRIRSNASERNYGEIVLEGANHACPLMHENLCNVHASLGETYLSNTCFSYPRVTRNVGGQIQQALQLSCPEAARQALLAPDAFDFIEGTISVRTETVGLVHASHGLSLDTMNEVRIFCLQLMRTDGLELWQRLALLGVFCEALGQAMASRRQAGIAALMDDFAALVASGQVLDALQGLQPNHSAQARMFARLWESKTATGHSDHQRAIMATTARNLGANPETGVVSAEGVTAAYQAGLAGLRQALSAVPHLLDHYLLNEIFLDLFPFDGDDPYDSYLQLVSRYGLLRLMLAAQCNEPGPLPSPAQLAGTVQVHSRLFRHSPEFAQQANNVLSSNGCNSLDKLYSFLRY